MEHFYCNLYKQRDTDDADFSSLNAQKLSQEDSDMTEGNVTAVEALAALRTMKNDLMALQLSFIKFLFE